MKPAVCIGQMKEAPDRQKRYRGFLIRIKGMILLSQVL